MDKIVFLATLAGKLSGYQMPPDAVETSLAQVKGYIDRVSDEDFAADPASEEDVEAIAKDIYSKYLASQAKEDMADETAEESDVTTEEAEVNDVPVEVAEESVEVPEEESDDESAETVESADEPEEEEDTAGETEVEQIFTAEEDDEPPAPEEIIEQLVAPEDQVNEASDDEFFEMLAKEAEGERHDLERVKELELKALAMANKDDPEMVAQVLSQDQELVEMVASSDIADEFDPIEAVFDPAQRPDIALEEADLAEALFVEEDDEMASELMVDSKRLKKVKDDSPGKKKNKNKAKAPKEKVKGSPLFWTLFIITLPITLPLYLVVCAFFAVLYVAVTALIVVFGGATVATVACGTALALVGLIYGSTQCLKSVAIGLFEIGVGIGVGGVTMLLSVLLYNIAIRFVPRLYRLINRFGGLVFGGIEKLYTKIKKECGKK
ncbi:MAG: hypothetical protein IJA55_04050 [Clostridia bacterium]|nr:hypothetical protein [Clostridia bacterium]